MSEGKSPGEGPERNPDGTYNKSQVGQREEQQKQGGNPTDDRARQERINRDDALHRGGFPVAGHGEPEPENDPGRTRSR
jgi:hypothetical protein